MKFQWDRWTVGGLTVGVLAVAALALSATQETPAGTANKISPSKVESVEGSKVKRVTLTQEGAGRLGLQTVPIAELPANKSIRTIPYSALLYLPDGSTWVYVKTAPLSFLREPVTVERIEGDTVRLSQSPPVGTEVVTVGVSEVYGAETGVGK